MGNDPVERAGHRRRMREPCNENLNAVMVRSPVQVRESLDVTQAGAVLKAVSEVRTMTPHGTIMLMT